MNIGLFNKEYTIRRFSDPENVKGYYTAHHSDFIASLHVHPMGNDEQNALPEGVRHSKSLEGHGDIELRTANEWTGQKGDLLYYHGDWYECISCQLWDHTVLSHYNYQFSMVPTDACGTIDTEVPPLMAPYLHTGGDC